MANFEFHKITNYIYEHKYQAHHQNILQYKGNYFLLSPLFSSRDRLNT
jgi:hypothetical protein